MYIQLSTDFINFYHDKSHHSINFNNVDENFIIITSEIISDIQ